MTPRLRSLAVAGLVALVLPVFACGDDGDDETCVESECTTPPAAFCSGDDLVVWSPAGICVDDACSYEATTTPCDGACVDAACVDSASDAGGTDTGATDAGATDAGTATDAADAGDA